jgi:hypothetical protein
MTNAISGSVRAVAPTASTRHGEACVIVGAKIGANNTGRDVLGSEHL